ncbi:MAG: glycosyltransferase [bacterium]|nr:glycosyltransferase [bacterium]
MTQNPTPKVLIVSHTAYMGGAERVLLRFLGEQQIGQFCLLAPEGPLAEAARQLGLNLRVSKGLAPLKRESNPLWPAVFFYRFLRASVEICVAVLAEGSQILQANGYASMPYLLLPRLFCAKPLVWHMHDFKPGVASGVLCRLFGAFSLKVVCVSESVATALKDQGLRREKLTVIPNHIRREHLSDGALLPLAQELRGRGQRLLGMMGSLETRKGFLEVLDALAQLPEGRWHLLIAGSAHSASQERYQQALETKVAELGLQEQVTFLGQQEDAGAFYASLDLFLHYPKEPDPLPTVLLEALVSGLPVAANDLGGNPEILAQGRWGRLVPAGDLGALVEVLNDPPPAPSPADQAALLAHFSLAHKEGAFLALYQQALGAHG